MLGRIGTWYTIAHNDSLFTLRPLYRRMQHNNASCRHSCNMYNIDMQQEFDYMQESIGTLVLLPR